LAVKHLTLAVGIESPHEGLVELAGFDAEK